MKHFNLIFLSLSFSLSLSRTSFLSQMDLWRCDDHDDDDIFL